MSIYDDKIVARFTNNIIIIDGASGIINKYIDRKRCDEINWKLERKAELINVKAENETQTNPNPKPNYLIGKCKHEI